MTEEDALQLAKAAAVKEEWDLSLYERAVGHHDGDRWHFLFRGKVPLVGNFFSVVVEPSGRTRLIPGH